MYKSRLNVSNFRYFNGISSFQLSENIKTIRFFSFIFSKRYDFKNILLENLMKQKNSCFRFSFQKKSIVFNVNFRVEGFSCNTPWYVVFIRRTFPRLSQKRPKKGFQFFELFENT